jgi:hypothetical protein
MHDSPKLLQTLLPLVIFVIWMIISAAANAKKKQYGGRTPQPNPVPQSDSERTYETPSSETEDKEYDTNWSDETSYRDQDNFPQETTTLADAPEPEKPVITTSETAAPVFSSDMLQKAMSVVEEEGAIRDEIASGPRKLNKEHNINIKISYYEMRKAMVWSEILAPPLALRDPK